MNRAGNEDCFAAESVVELEAMIAELRAGGGEWPPWIETREEAIADLEGQIYAIKAAEPGGADWDADAAREARASARAHGTGAE